MENSEYIKKLEDLKEKNLSKIENFKLIINQFQSNIESIESEINKLEIEIGLTKNIESELKNQFFELCVLLKI